MTIRPPQHDDTPHRVEGRGSEVEPEDHPADGAEANTDGAGNAGSEGAAATDPHDRPYLPWRGKATRTDKALLYTILGIFVLLLVLWPMRPFLIASHPVVLAFATGSKAAIGAVAAFAEAGRFPVWLAVVAGVVGMSKFDWLFWWTGRQWGQGIITMFAQGETAQRFVEKIRHMNPWVLRAAVVLSYAPGVPAILVYALAGSSGMRLLTFLVLDTLGALTMTGIVVGAGYAAGQRAIDLIIAIDNYAIWVSLGIVFVMTFLTAFKAQRKMAKEQARRTKE